MGPALVAVQVLVFAAVLGYLFWPLLTATPADWAVVPSARVGRAERQAQERRDAVLRAIRDLDADLELGRVSPEEHRADRERLVAEAATLLDPAGPAGAVA